MSWRPLKTSTTFRTSFHSRRLRNNSRTNSVFLCVCNISLFSTSVLQRVCFSLFSLRLCYNVAVCLSFLYASVITWLSISLFSLCLSFNLAFYLYLNYPSLLFFQTLFEIFSFSFYISQPVFVTHFLLLSLMSACSIFPFSRLSPFSFFLFCFYPFIRVSLVSLFSFLSFSYPSLSLSESYISKDITPFSSS